MGFGVWGWGGEALSCRIRMLGSGFEVYFLRGWFKGYGLRVQGLGVEISGFRISGLGFRVKRCEIWIQGCGIGA